MELPNQTMVAAIDNPALKAQNLLTNEFFMGVVEKQRELYIRNIINSQPDETAIREDAYTKIRALDEFIATLDSMARQPEIEKKRFKIF
jgi:hypothetical protein